MQASQSVVSTIPGVDTNEPSDGKVIVDAVAALAAAGPSKLDNPMPTVATKPRFSITRRTIPLSDAVLSPGAIVELPRSAISLIIIASK
jgi:hypothetical protein